ncbi:MAG: hypothetical protein B2I17_07850 [Thermoplasmatales archaeon B_DKE]|nr:MAG: hypothetical protein B2I17_07850 [Thermoplasmatales archaeon B_DKE]
MVNERKYPVILGFECPGYCCAGQADLDTERSMRILAESRYFGAEKTSLIGPSDNVPEEQQNP